MEQEHSIQPKWESQASADLKGSKAQEVWPLLADFCNIHKWFPNLHTCYPVQGVSGQPGLVRYCEMKRDITTMIDPINQSITYEVGDNNLGLKSYVAARSLVIRLKARAWKSSSPLGILSKGIANKMELPLVSNTTY